jgi:quercetin 2,3-dioxygenase
MGARKLSDVEITEHKDHNGRNNYLMSKITIHKAGTRGHANHGWLNSFHSFSFADYYNPERMHFGALRVLNDDTVAPGMGFGKHPHNNMEIISIPLEGDLEHQDSMGHTQVIKRGDVQVMSAGVGVFHSEYNRNKDQEVKFLQIWIMPNKKDVKPRYDQVTLDLEDRKNKLQQIISPNENGEGLWIHQDAWFFIGNFEEGKQIDYSVKRKENGVYVFVLKGKVNIEGNDLDSRDGIGISETDKISIKSLKDDTEILLMDVPMNW